MTVDPLWGLTMYEHIISIVDVPLSTMVAFIQYVFLQ